MPKDLVVLTADKNIDYGIRGLLSRPAAFQIRPIQVDTFVHPRRDPGCLREAQDFLRPFVREYRQALVIFDYRGCGREDQPPNELADEVRGRVAGSSWEDRAEVIVLDPELEVWVFATSPQVERVLGWPEGRKPIRRWLEGNGLWGKSQAKPADPKTALERLFFEIKKPRSSTIYLRLGEQVSFRNCRDPGFLKLRDTLGKWFPAGGGK